MFDIESFPKALRKEKNVAMLTGILRGVERESLRVNLSGELSNKPHPKGLGSALTHPQITTDFSEALLEFITPPTHRIEDLFEHLESIQKFVLENLSDEVLWANSMPCQLGNDADIPVARYGTSNNGVMKTVYRVGLGHRYGRSMQTVAGIHYNFSLPNAFWALLSREQNSISGLQGFKDQAYFGLIRNFRRYYCLLIYLFGASPVLCKSFVEGKKHKLETMPDDKALYLPHATSLRMGDLGYQSSVQESLYVCYNDKKRYIESLCRAITSSHPIYEEIGLKDPDGHYRQLNTSILQIENEFYSAIRPKRTARPGETALSALENRGVEYIEVRCLDINPFSPVGIERSQVYFLDTFLVYCALKNSPDSDSAESARILRNQKRVVNEGRRSTLMLEMTDGTEATLEDFGLGLLDAMKPVAELLDQINGGDYSRSLAEQRKKIQDASLTPSARVLAQLQAGESNFAQFALEQSKQHDAQLKSTRLPDEVSQRMRSLAEESMTEQSRMEQLSSLDFDTFLKQYYQQYSRCSGNSGERPWDDQKAPRS